MPPKISFDLFISPKQCKEHYFKESIWQSKLPLNKSSLDFRQIFCIHWMKLKNYKVRLILIFRRLQVCVKYIASILPGLFCIRGMHLNYFVIFQNYIDVLLAYFVYAQCFWFICLCSGYVFYAADSFTACKNICGLNEMKYNLQYTWPTIEHKAIFKFTAYIQVVPWYLRGLASP